MSTQTTDTELKELLEKFSRNSIVLDISEEVPITKGWTRFGGQPDVPPDFEWPTFKGENCESITKERPLNYPGSTRKGCSQIMVCCRSSTKSTLNGGALIRLTKDARASIGLRT